ncbi:S-methyl-5'-thioadenosine phosphorylase [subsurface metagenome]|nr:S-methyl-5'-thioadenosine phosphorylase [Dehalococcoidia bacterium]
MPQAKIAVIGGSGLYDIEGMKDIEEVDINTPFGRPSDKIVVGKLEGVGVAFLPRHGRGHRLLPTEVPYRANIYALKLLGAERIIGINSVGSLKEEFQPNALLIPDQLIDRTWLRASTFFGEGIVAHIPFGEPFCPSLSNVVHQSAKDAGATVHKGGTCVVMEGPAFSTRAESLLYRSWGADVIGMTALPEAKLAREAEICYAVIACVTDYDCWHRGHDAVTAEMIISRLHQNIDTAKQIIKLAVGKVTEKRDCDCATALSTALITSPDVMPEAQKKKLDLLIGKYLKKD